MQQVIKRILLFLSCCGTLIVLGYIGFWVFFSILLSPYPFDMNGNPFDNVVFNRAVWDDDKSSSDSSNRRFGMADDILKNQLKPGMTVEQVVAILGETEIGFPQKAKPQTIAKLPPSDRYIGYYLGEDIGEWKGKFIYRGWLRLYFDAKGLYTHGDYDLHGPSVSK